MGYTASPAAASAARWESKASEASALPEIWSGGTGIFPVPPDLCVYFPPLPEIRALESGMYACIYTDSYDEEIPCAKKLLEFCRANEYQRSTAGGRALTFRISFCRTAATSAAVI